MAEKTQRSELNYVIAGAIMFFAGGYLINFGKDDGGTAMIIVGTVALLTGLFLLGKGVLRGRRA